MLSLRSAINQVLPSRNNANTNYATPRQQQMNRPTRRTFNDGERNNKQYPS